MEPKVLVDQKNKKAFATGGDVVLANGEKIPLPGGFALPTSGIWSGLLDIPQVCPQCTVLITSMLAPSTRIQTVLAIFHISGGQDVVEGTSDIWSDPLDVLRSLNFNIEG